MLLLLPVVTRLDQLLRQAGLPELAVLEPAALPLIAAAVTAATVGAVLASRRPRHPVGWLLLTVGLSEQFSNFASDYVHYGVMARPGELPAAGYLTGFYNSGIVVMVTCIGFVVLLTPTGSLPTPRWRWWACLQVAATVLLLVSAALDLHPLEPEDPTFVSPLAAPAALSDLVGLAGTAGAVSILAGLVAVAVVAVAVLGGPLGVVLFGAGISVALLPVATGRRSCATASMTWTGSSAAPWPTGSSPSCSPAATPGSCSASASSWARIPAWSWPPPPWPWPPPSSRPAAASRRRWTGASTAAATTPPRPSPPSAPACATRST